MQTYPTSSWRAQGDGHLSVSVQGVLHTRLPINVDQYLFASSPAGGAMAYVVDPNQCVIGATQHLSILTRDGLRTCDPIAPPRGAAFAGLSVTDEDEVVALAVQHQLQHAGPKVALLLYSVDGRLLSDASQKPDGAAPYSIDASFAEGESVAMASFVNRTLAVLAGDGRAQRLMLMRDISLPLAELVIPKDAAGAIVSIQATNTELTHAAVVRGEFSGYTRTGVLIGTETGRVYHLNGTNTSATATPASIDILRGSECDRQTGKGMVLKLAYDRFGGRIAALVSLGVERRVVAGEVRYLAVVLLYVMDGALKPLCTQDIVLKLPVQQTGLVGTGDNEGTLLLEDPAKVKEGLARSLRVLPSAFNVDIAFLSAASNVGAGSMTQIVLAHRCRTVVIDYARPAVFKDIFIDDDSLAGDIFSDAATTRTAQLSDVDLAHRTLECPCHVLPDVDGCSLAIGDYHVVSLYNSMLQLGGDAQLNVPFNTSTASSTVLAEPTLLRVAPVLQSTAAMYDIGSTAPAAMLLSAHEMIESGLNKEGDAESILAMLRTKCDPDPQSPASLCAVLHGMLTAVEVEPVAMVEHSKGPLGAVMLGKTMLGPGKTLEALAARLAMILKFLRILATAARWREDRQVDLGLTFATPLEAIRLGPKTLLRRLMSRSQTGTSTVESSVRRESCADLCETLALDFFGGECLGEVLTQKLIERIRQECEGEPADEPFQKYVARVSAQWQRRRAHKPGSTGSAYGLVSPMFCYTTLRVLGQQDETDTLRWDKVADEAYLKLQAAGKDGTDLVHLLLHQTGSAYQRISFYEKYGMGEKALLEAVRTGNSSVVLDRLVEMHTRLVGTLATDTRVLDLAGHEETAADADDVLSQLTLGKQKRRAEEPMTFVSGCLRTTAEDKRLVRQIRAVGYLRDRVLATSIFAAYEEQVHFGNYMRFVAAAYALTPRPGDNASQETAQEYEEALRLQLAALFDCVYRTASRDAGERDAEWEARNLARQQDYLAEVYAAAPGMLNAREGVWGTLFQFAGRLLGEQRTQDEKLRDGKASAQTALAQSISGLSALDTLTVLLLRDEALGKEHNKRVQLSEPVWVMGNIRALVHQKDWEALRKFSERRECKRYHHLFFDRVVGVAPSTVCAYYAGLLPDMEERALAFFRLNDFQGAANVMAKMPDEQIAGLRSMVSDATANRAISKVLELKAQARAEKK